MKLGSHFARNSGGIGTKAEGRSNNCGVAAGRYDPSFRSCFSGPALFSTTDKSTARRSCKNCDSGPWPWRSRVETDEVCDHEASGHRRPCWSNRAPANTGENNCRDCPPWSRHNRNRVCLNPAYRQRLVYILGERNCSYCLYLLLPNKILLASCCPSLHRAPSGSLTF